MAPFWHGSGVHSSMSVSQCCPVYPGTQSHWYAFSCKTNEMARDYIINHGCPSHNADMRSAAKQMKWREINRIYHHTVEGTRESHPSVHDLQSTTRLAESWMLQIMDTRMGFPCPFHSVVIDYFSPTPFIFNE